METPLHSYLLPASICRSFSPPCAGSEVASHRSLPSPLIVWSVSLIPLSFTRTRRGEDMRGNKWWIVDVRLTRIQLWGNGRITGYMRFLPACASACCLTSPAVPLALRMSLPPPAHTPFLITSGGNDEWSEEWLEVERVGNGVGGWPRPAERGGRDGVSEWRANGPAAGTAPLIIVASPVRFRLGAKDGAPPSRLSSRRAKGRRPRVSDPTWSETEWRGEWECETETGGFLGSFRCLPSPYTPLTVRRRFIRSHFIPPSFTSFTKNPIQKIVNNNKRLER